MSPAGRRCARSWTWTPRLTRAAGQATLFDLWRFDRFLHHPDPGLLDSVPADNTHHWHAINEPDHAALKRSALAHLPSGVVTANAAWLVLAVLASNLDLRPPARLRADAYASRRANRQVRALESFTRQ
jgi:predicted metal-dependent hydrolase